MVNRNKDNIQGSTMSDFDPQDLRDLTEQLRALNGMLASNGSFNKNLTEFGSQVADSTKQIKENDKISSETAKKQQADIKKNIAASEQYRKKQEERNQVEQEYIKTRERVTGLSDTEYSTLKKKIELSGHEARAIKEGLELAKSQRSSSSQVLDAMISAGNGSDLLKNKFFDLAGDSVAAQAGLRTAAEGAKSLTSAFISYNKAIYEGKRGPEVAAEAFAKMTESVGTFITTVGSIASALSWFLPGGLAIKGIQFSARALGILGVGAMGAGTAVKAFGEYNKIAATQTRKLFDTYNELSKAGITGADGMNTVFKQIQQFGMSVSEAEAYVKLLGEHRNDLSVIGGFASQGAQDFADVAASFRDTDLSRMFERMGVTEDQQREGVLSFLTNQARMGKLNLKNTEDIVKASAKYIEETELLAELTGSDRKSRQSAQEKLMAQDQFAAAMTHAEVTNNQPQKERLSKANELAQALMMRGQENEAKSLQSFAAVGNASGIGVKGNLQYRFNDVLNDKSLSTTAERLAALDKNLEQNQRRFSGINKFFESGKIDEIAITGAAKAREIAIRGKQQEEVAGAEGKGVIDYVQSLLSKRQDNKELKDMVDALRNQKEIAKMQDSYVRQMNYSAEIHKSSSEMFRDAVEKFGEAVGLKSTNKNTIQGGPPAGGGTSVTNINSQTSAMAKGTQQLLDDPTKKRNFSTLSQIQQHPKYVEARRSGASAKEAMEQARIAITGNDYSQDTVKQQVTDLIDFSGGIAGHRQNFDSLDSDLKDRILTAAAAYNKQTKRKLTITSGARSYQDQVEIKRKEGKNAAEPGTSKHEKGLAVDIGNVDNDLAKILQDSGLKQTVSGEKWHFEKARTGGLFSGPSTGYNVELHGDEIVTPANDGVSKQALGTGSGAFGGSNEAQEKMVAILEHMAEKYDTVINLLSEGNDNREKLVRAMA
jgi:LAS superfamily LD-carboxypeptidase LdcB